MVAIVSSDHGTVEKWLYPDGTIDTGHTDSHVPFILVHTDRDISLREEGELADIAPTVLELMGIPQSPYMTGQFTNKKHIPATHRSIRGKNPTRPAFDSRRLG